jgi:hypothetical protein
MWNDDLRCVITAAKRVPIGIVSDLWSKRALSDPQSDGDETNRGRLKCLCFSLQEVQWSH